MTTAHGWPVCVTYCAYCRGQVRQPRRGRRRRYCGQSCRQRAYRRRRAAKVATMRLAGMGRYVPLLWLDYRKPHPYEGVTSSQKLIHAAASTG